MQRQLLHRRSGVGAGGGHRPLALRRSRRASRCSLISSCPDGTPLPAGGAAEVSGPRRPSGSARTSATRRRPSSARSSGLANLGACLGALVAVPHQSVGRDTDQPDFINAAALHRTPLEPPAPCWVRSKRIERELGRTPSYRWGPRAIDLDILTFGGPDDRASADLVDAPPPALRASVRSCAAGRDRRPLSPAARDALGKRRWPRSSSWAARTPHQR